MARKKATRRDTWPDHVQGIRARIAEVYTGSTAKEIGAELGMSAETVRRQLVGKNDISLRLAILVAVQADVPLDWLLLGHEPWALEKAWEPRQRRAMADQLDEALHDLRGVARALRAKPVRPPRRR